MSQSVLSLYQLFVETNQNASVTLPLILTFVKQTNLNPQDKQILTIKLTIHFNLCVTQKKK
jgi:transcriptional antiterminator